MSAEPVPTEASEPAALETSPLTPDDEGNYDLKRKFREALARKRGAQADTAEGAANANAPKVRATHGPAASQRSFRRKSGG
ncbi:DUF5302 domain-containing protein [Streptomyces mutabilis]|uniref:DUF5302 domain-containing protein n=1 Tax=Streptomyces mutabilis TaxID=67332 RepID=UPI000A237E3E|nr:DUF5302 domain-containing protein [Streptomyces sp. alain-838]OSC69391.1 hypothetical protein B5181_12990 [Streptomyces sp. 4F]PAK27192.1 hypothetical protein CJD44_05680 [Streptomyces sp. alain-838]